MKRSICPICNRFYMESLPENRMCDDCYVYKVRAVEYVKSHRFASIAEVTLATSVPIRTLKKLIEHSYIILSEN